MFEARRKLVVQDIPALSSFPEKHADQIFRLNLAKWTLKDEEFLKQTHDFEDKIADQVFQVKLQRPYIMPGRVAVNIHFDARQDANKRLYDEHLNEALQYSKSEELANKFMEEKYVYWLYEEEMRLLKEQENWLAISKKKKKLYDIYMEKMKEDAMSVSLEEWEKRQNLTMEDLGPEDERFVLATPEGFVNYKFQLAETMNQQG
jgi:vesicle coat complex subunit